MRYRGMGGAALIAVAAAGQAQAGEVPLYKAAPGWIVAAPPVAVEAGDDAPILASFDAQQRLEDGEVWSYQDVATRMTSPEVVAQAGTVAIPWHPARGDLIVHRVEILRGAERIDALAGDRRFAVLRREQQMEQLTFDGLLTATLSVEGLRVGDVLRVTASTTIREPTFGKAMQAAVGLPMLPVRAGFVRARMLWPAATPVAWRAYPEGARPVATTRDGMRELVLTGVFPKAPDLPDDAPLRYRRLPIVEASSFADWAAVSTTMAPLYATAGTIAPGSELAAEVARIKAAQPDPRRRAAAALELVQERVRYLFNGMANGNYQPQSPAQTWALRYGDCKAKTLLLLAMLDALGIEAEAVLANAQLGDMLPERLPGAGAFDHVLVRATIDGETLWLDGTGRGARLADMGDTPPLRWVLPLRLAGAALVAVPARPPARPVAAVTVDIDQSAGIELPALIKAEMRVRGPLAEMLGLAKTQGSREQQAEGVGGLMSGVAGTPVALSRFAITYDRDAAEATVTAEGVGQTRWRREEGRRSIVLDRGVTGLSFDPDRSRAAWAKIPVATGQPETASYRTRIRLPDGGKGFVVEGDSAELTPLPGTVVRRAVTLAEATLSVDERVERSGVEIAPGDIPAARAGLARAQQRLLTAVAPPGAATRWQSVAAGRRDGRFKPILAAYAAAIAAEPDERDGYLNRARFLIGIYDWRAALPDLDRALAIQNDVETLSLRAAAWQQLGDGDKAAADYRAIAALDPSSEAAVAGLGRWDIDHGRRDAALARVQERIDAGGTRRPQALSTKADLLVRAGDGAGALAAIEEAVKARPTDIWLLNSRCWIKAQLNVTLDTALKDCTRAIELGSGVAAVLDSRALVFLRQGRLDEAKADLDAALDLDPQASGSLFLRAVVARRRGDAAAAKADLDAARMMAPQIEPEYRRFGVTI